MDSGLPKWKCKKIIEGFKIGVIEYIDNGGAEIKSDCGKYVVRVQQSYLDKHRPDIGGYYVRYQGGYESWSPADALEDGYDPIVEQ